MNTRAPPTTTPWTNTAMESLEEKTCASPPSYTEAVPAKTSTPTKDPTTRRSKTKTILRAILLGDHAMHPAMVMERNLNRTIQAKAAAAAAVAVPPPYQPAQQKPAANKTRVTVARKSKSLLRAVVLGDHARHPAMVMERNLNRVLNAQEAMNGRSG